MAEGQGILIKWYPEPVTPWLDDCSNECVFKFQKSDFRTTFTKKPKDGTLKPAKSARSFSFSIVSKNGTTALRCVVDNLPGEISGEPKYEFKDGMIKVKVQKISGELWGNNNELKYMDSPDF